MSNFKIGEICVVIAGDFTGYICRIESELKQSNVVYYKNEAKTRKEWVHVLSCVEPHLPERFNNVNWTERPEHLRKIAPVKGKQNEHETQNN